MRRSNLETRFFKTKNVEIGKMYKKQKNYCSRLYKKERRKYYAKLDLKNITDNKKFWKTMQPFLTNKGNNPGKVTLIENDKILYADNEVAETFNTFFFKCSKKSWSY